MKKYRAKLNSERVIGPLSESDIQTLFKSEKLNLQSLIQVFPDGEWLEFSKFDEFNKSQDTFIRTLDSLEEETVTNVSELVVQEREEFPQEFKFTKETPKENIQEESLNVDKTVLISKEQISSSKLAETVEDDKTQIKPETLKYLEELKKQAKEETKEQVEQPIVDEIPKHDLENDSTQLINLEDFKNDLADEATETEINLEKERKEIAQEKENVLGQENKKQNATPKAESALSVKTDKKAKNKKIIYLVILLVGMFMFFDDEDKPVASKKIDIVNPVIKFPLQFETENELLATKFLKEGLELLNKPTYINKVKAAIKFRVSTEHKFRSNKATAHLIRVYSELLVNSNSQIQDQSKIFKLVQINMAKAISDPLYAEAIATFYLYSGKPLAAQKTIEKFNSITKNKPTIELFALYLDILRINNSIKKANSVFSKLESVKKKNFRVSLSLINYYNFIGEETKFKNLLTETYKNNQYSVNLLLKSVKVLIDENKFDIAPKVLIKVKELEAEKSREYYSKYLEYQGIIKVYKKEFKVANNYFKEALRYNESSELRSRLATLNFSGDPISDVLIAESKAVALIKRSLTHKKNNNTSLAFKDALEATRVAQDYIPAKLHLATLQIENGLFNEAIDSLEALQKRNVTDPEVTFSLINAYTEAYKFNEVKKLLSILSTSTLVDNYRYYTATAKYYVFKEDFYNSINWLQLAIRKNPLDEEMHYELAKILIRHRKYRKAKVFLSKLIDINPIELKYRVAYSNILYEAEGITYAVGYLYDLLQDYPSNPQLLSAIGIYYYKSGQQKKYEQIKSELIKLPTKDPSLYKFLIESALLDNDSKLLIGNLSKLIELEPGNLQMRILLGKTYLNNEQFKEALTQFKEVESRLKTYPKLQYFMSKLYLLTDDNDKAIELAKAEVNSNPQNIEGYVLLGDIYTKDKMHNEAEDMYKKAQKIDDNNIETMIGLSSINLKKSQFDIAIDLLLKARNVDPNNANVHKLLGDAYRKIGQSSLATESYKIFLELSPNSRYKDEINTYLRIMQ